MSLLWIEGFEGFGTSNGSAVSGMSLKYPTAGADSNFTLRAGRVSGHSIETSNTILNNHFQTPSFTSMATVIIGFAFKQAAYNATYDLLSIRDSTVVHMTLRNVSSTGEWRAMRAGTTQLGSDTSGAAVSAGSWAYVEVKCTISDAAGVFELYVNGIQYLNLTSQDTRNAGNSTCDNFRWTGSTNASDDTTLDDIYICDSSGSDNNTFLGSQVVVGLLPAADTSAEDFTLSTGADSYALCDENPANGDTDYIESSTSGQATRFTYGTLSGVTNVKGIQINTTCRETDANPFSIYNQVKSGATTSDGTAQGIGSTSYVSKSRVVEQDPDTAALWTVSGINAAEFGVKVA